MHLGDSVCLESHHTPEGQRVSLGTARVAVRGQQVSERTARVQRDRQWLRGQCVSQGTARVSRDSVCREGQQLPEGTATRLVAPRRILGTARAGGQRAAGDSQHPRVTPCAPKTHVDPDLPPTPPCLSFPKTALTPHSFLGSAQ